ncbi:helix-turn-helix domain-containing protein [Leptolyngbya sp. FACHB-261]|uniref:helix-turn-helix domain-containing protein n=1 Tax=Leptolyngbya sp. FACHB-261 TaxID=2692806 RepID=UPI001683C9D5|nr:helix-turn-helix domain-containing protein [Leptolyngbya sp. FACHB-261]MBD2101010.1 helix-turn-helix domain-containing protein [Leptolyngbya sp. FACHB-261]
MSGKHLSDRELTLLQLYSGCYLSMQPQDFYLKWSVTHEEMARICRCSISTVDRWFLQGRNRRVAEPIYTYRLAEMDFLWESYEQIPKALRRRLCRQQSQQSEN